MAPDTQGSPPQARHHRVPIAPLATSLALLVAALAALPIALGTALASPSRQGQPGRRPAARTTRSPPAHPALAGSPLPGSAATVPAGPVALAGCPLPYRPPYTGPPVSPPHPPQLVPESSLPTPPPPAPRTRRLSALSGKGLWTWKLSSTEGGDTARIVARARSAGLHQLWVRVGDSVDGFYAGAELRSLVPAAHREGLAVIGWGFPYLYDPVKDARWSQAALHWRGPGGAALDGFSPDIETASEGVALSPRRVVTYLGLVRPADAGRPLVATVFPPTDHFLPVYPYAAMAPYVDAYAPMVYWGCQQPGHYAALALRRLTPLAPVHLVGQGYNMADEGGRPASPSAAEVVAFLDVARADGAVGASLWVWQSMDGAEWSALSSFSWGASGGHS